MADFMDEVPLPEEGASPQEDGYERDPDLIGSPSSDDLTTDDLEAAYLRAMEAIDGEEWGIDAESELDSTESNDSIPESGAVPIHFISHTDGRAALALDDVPTTQFSGQDDVATSSAETVRISSHSAIDEVEIAGADFLTPHQTKNAEFEHQSTAGGPRTQSGPAEPSAVESSPRGSTRTSDAKLPAPNATRIIEACLFVGGQPLSAKRLATLLESTSDPSHLEQLVDELNLEYASQQRPYEIRLGDGGYRMALRTEFEAVRNRVYGVGPRDVKLSQDVLEVLAFVAYQQPIVHSAVEACGKPNVANILRQLLRRELITLTRIDQTRMGVEYRTSPRFLQVFGLGNLNELPRPDDLAMR